MLVRFLGFFLVLFGSLVHGQVIVSGDSLLADKATCVDTISFKNCHEAMAYFGHYNFYIDSLRGHKTVPRVHLVNYPADLKKASFYHKKNLFLNSVLSSVLKANEEVLCERHMVFALHEKDSLNEYETAIYNELKRKYYAKSFEELKLKVDVLPPSVVMAQGIDESGWGTSFFAQEANSVFGMKAPRKSSLPTIKHPRYSFVSYKFSSLDEGIKEYMLNINRHYLYAGLHNIRAKKRLKGEPVSGVSLLPGMVRYSSRGHAYLNTIRKFIKMYNLADFDHCSLASHQEVYMKFID